MLPELQLAGCPEIAHLDQYAGVWSIDPQHARSFIRSVNSLNLAVHVAQHQPAAEQRAIEMRRGAFEEITTGRQDEVLAVVEIRGVMTKFGGSLSSAGSTMEARRKIRSAVRDSRVQGILLVFDTPGGSVSGTPDLAAEVRSATKQKPVYAYCEDLCCSAGYFVASQATRIFANGNAVVGSIGVFTILEDWSQAFEEAGVAVHVVKFGEHKADGAFGTAISDETLAEFQRLVDAHGEQFVAAVSQGRGLSKSATAKLADGRVHVGSAAVDLKLIDGVQSLDKTIADLVRHKPASGKSQASADPLLALDHDTEAGETAEETSEGTKPAVNETLTQEDDAMSTTPAAPAAPTTDDKPQAATYAQILAACKGLDENSGDDAKFAGSCLKRELTIEQARDEWTETLAARLEARDQELAAATVSKSAKPAGNKPVDDGDSAGSTSTAAAEPVAQWEEAVAEHVKAGKTRREAAALANRQNPGLREAAVAAWNQSRKTR